MRKGFTVIELMVILAIIGILTAFVLPGCVLDEDQGSADKAQKEATEQAMAEAQSQIGMPAIKNFQERKLAKMIFELRDQEDLVCYAYIVNKMEGKLVFLGKCIGFGLPYSVQYTNPMKYLDDPNGTYDAGSVVVPQADPNGLFMPEGLSATWLMMLDSSGEPHPVYIEPEIVVSPFPML